MLVSESDDDDLSYVFLSRAYRTLHSSWMFVTVETFMSFEIALSCIVILLPILRAVVD